MGIEMVTHTPLIWNSFVSLWLLLIFVLRG